MNVFMNDFMNDSMKSFFMLPRTATSERLHGVVPET